MVNSQTRAEIRYYLASAKTTRVRKALTQMMNRNIFPNPYNQTLYFNNDEHEVPFTYSIRARRYENKPLRNRFKLRPKDNWIFELKTTRSVNGRFIRHKRRDEELTLREILRRVGEIRKLGGVHIRRKLVSYAAASYARSHFLENQKGIRVTVDEDVRFYRFTGELTGRMLGKADHSVVELKIPPRKTSSTLAGELQKMMRDEAGVQGISKKATTFNLMADESRKMGEAYAIPKHDTEIEAKISVDGDGQDVFHDIREDFDHGHLDGFQLSPDFPRVMETGKLHHYLLTSTNDYVRVEPRRESQYLTVKEDLEVTEDPYDLGNVIRRREVIGQAHASLLKQSSRILQRKRKYFMVERKDGKGEYAVVIDRTTHKGHELYQMEVEDVLESPSFNIERQSVEDVASIANFLVEEYSLEPTTLTKGEWLMSLPN